MLLKLVIGSRRQHDARKVSDRFIGIRFGSAWIAPVLRTSEKLSAGVYSTLAQFGNPSILGN